MSSREQFAEFMQTGGKQLGLDITDGQVELYYQFMELLIEWNQKINLTAITGMKDIVVKHFLDSLAIFSKIEVQLHAKIIDVGTGAGFPGVPIKIYRKDLQSVLVDSLMKRVKFLEEIKGKLNLTKVEMLHGRAEEVGHLHGYRETFDIAVSRAVAKLPVLLEYNIPFLKRGGIFLAYKGPDGIDEAKTAVKAAVELGAELEREIKIELPFDGDRRTLIVFVKKGPTPEKYPRKAGTPEKKPL